MGLGIPTDGCVNPNDEITIFLRAFLGTTGNNRYDLQIFTALDGNDAKAAGATCSRTVLQPTVESPADPTAAQLLNGSGLYRDEDDGTEVCGDVEKTDNVFLLPSGDNADAAYDFPFPVTLACSDSFNNDGFLDVPTCLTYENSQSSICTSPASAWDPNNAKCRCDQATSSNVPIPNLRCGSVPTVDDNTIQTVGEMVCVDLGHDGSALNPTCNQLPPNLPGPDPTCIGVANDGDLTPGEAAQCVVRYRNAPVGTCVVPPAPFLTDDAERFACGAVGFVRFDVNFDNTRGSIISSNTSLDSGASDILSFPSAGVLRWTPRSNAPNDSPGLTGLGIVRRGDASTLTFRYQANPTNVGVQNVSFTMDALWANVQDFSLQVDQLNLTCNDTLRTTPVVISYFRADESGGKTTFRWTTETEAGNLGFNIYGKRGADWVKLNDQPIPSRAISSSVALDYSFELADVDATMFRIEDLDLQGDGQTHGPFRLGRDYGSRAEKSTIDWAAIRADLDQPHGVIKKATAAKGGPVAASAGPVALQVSQTGLHRVTFEALSAAGFDLTKAQSSDLALSVGGKQVPIRVVGGKFFAAGSYFEFWGEALDTLYTGTNVYRLELLNKVGLRVATDATAIPAGSGPVTYAETVMVETNAVYSLNAPGPDPFVERVMQRFGAPVSRNFTVPVQGLVAGGDEVVHVELWGVNAFGTSADHHVKLLLNGAEIADRTFNGLEQAKIDVPVTGLLVEGANTVTVQLLADNGLPVDVIAVETYGVTYPRSPAAKAGALVLDAAGAVVQVSGLPSSNGVAYRLDAAGPVFLSSATFTGGAARFPGVGGSARYAVSDVSALKVPGIQSARTPGDLLAGAAEYLVITHGAFQSGLGALVSARQADGLSVGVVDVADIYTAYNGGVVDADAIRDYIADAVRSRGTLYVLLVGGDTYDYRNYVGSSVSFVPSLYVATSDLIQRAPADSAYADVDGDGVQDLAIGRFPVRTLTELGYMIDKTLQYAGKHYDNVAVLAADKFDAVGNMSFKVQSEEFLAGLDGSWDATKAYLDDGTVADKKAALLAAVNAGAALTGFFGHSAPALWTFSNLLRTSDVATLANDGRPTVLVQWGCWNTYYVEPANNTMGHAWTVFGTHGAAAVLGSSTLVDDSSARELSSELAPVLAQPGMPIGIALVEAKQRLADRRGGLVDVQLGFGLLGDPALVISQ